MTIVFEDVIEMIKDAYQEAWDNGFDAAGYSGANYPVSHDDDYAHSAARNNVDMLYDESGLEREDGA